MITCQQAVGLFIIAYLIASLILRSRRPHIPIWSLMAFSSFIAVMSGLVNVESLGEIVDMNVILFLIGMFSLVGLLENSGLLEAISYKFISRFKSRGGLLVASAYLFGLLAAVAVNDTIALMGPPIAVLIAKVANIDPRAMALLLMFSLTIGSALTPIGNPQNMLIVINSGMPAPFVYFTTRLFIPTMLNLLLTAFIIKKYYGIEEGEVRVALIPHEAIRNKRDAVLGATGLLITIAALVVNDLLELMGLPHIQKRGFIPFVIAAGVYPFTSSPRKLLSSVDWGTILFFITMYITTAGIWNSGDIEPLFRLFLPIKGDPLTSVIGISLASLVTSQLISNVPFAGLYVHYLKGLGYAGSDIGAWLTLATASTIAGNLTILGAASNVIVIEALESRFGITITFREFLKIGAIVTAVNMLVYIPFLLL